MTRQTYASARSRQSRPSSIPRRNPARAYRERHFQKTSDEPVPVPPPTTQMRSSLEIGLAALVAATGIAGAIALSGSSLRISNLPAIAPVRASLTSEEVYRKASAAVVTIDTPKRSSGSGVFINRSGMLLTNEHVVEQFSTVRVTMFDGRSGMGRTIRVDKANDLAVVQIESSPPSNCLPIETAALRIGQVVYALGSPLRMQQTFTNGVVSRHAETGEVLHSAAIAPGSSGSPLLDDRGRIVGINRAVITQFRSLSIAAPARNIRQLPIELNCDP